MSSYISRLSSKNRPAFDLSVILLVSILAVVPIYFWGIPGGADMYQHFQFANIYYDAIISGDLYPGWAHLPNYESGDVGVRFYPPLTYFVFSVFRWLAGNWFDASCLMFAFCFFVGAAGIYKWSRESFSENGSLMAALIYVIIPYHINQIYQGSLLAEFTAAAIMPYCFWFITRIGRGGKVTDVCALGITYGLLILTHLPTTMMASIAFLIYALFSLRRSDYIQSILKLGVGVGIGIILSSFYWMRMIFELDFVKHTDSSYSTQSQHYAYHANFVFPFLIDLDLRRFNRAEMYIDLLCLVPLVILLYSLLFYYLKTKDKFFRPLTNILIVSGFALFMTTPLSRFVWEYVPGLSRIQFPWRWLIIFSIGASLVVAASFDIVLEYLKTSKRSLALIFFGIFAVCFLYEYFYIMNHFGYYPRDFFISIVEKNKTMPSNECWWSSWTQQSKEPKPGLPRPELLPAKLVLNDRAFEVLSWKPLDRQLRISAGAAGEALFATSYYPHWKATVNGQAVEVKPNEFGAISFPVPAEESEIRVYFEEPRYVTNTYYAAGLAWLLILAVSAIYLFQNRRKHPETAQI